MIYVDPTTCFEEDVEYSGDGTHEFDLFFNVPTPSECMEKCQKQV